MLDTSLPQTAYASDADYEFIDAIIKGLSQPQKTLPCRYFYDDRGSDLFEMITELPEYYLTRSEASLLQNNAPDIMNGLSADTAIVEFGAGSSRKMDALLRHAPLGLTFVPIDVSRHALVEARARLSLLFPGLTVRPVVDDFSSLDALPSDLTGKTKHAFFLGSTIGNFDRSEAIDLLRSWKLALGPRAQLVVGADILKDRDTLLAAYNDAAGVTKAFNLNILARINGEFGPIFDLSNFEHSAVFNAEQSRIEMHLVSRVPQVVHLFGRSFKFSAGETIHTENSYKHSPSAFRAIVASAGWRIERTWTDGLFSLYRLA